MDISYLFRTGVVGWQAESRAEYATHAQLHNLTEVLIAVNSKNGKPKKAPRFDSLFPVHSSLSLLGRTVQTNLALKLPGVLATFKRMK